MAYTKQNFQDGQIITAEHLNKIENGILAANNPRNLLDNSDFTNPINQRGQSSYYNTNIGIDRWYLTGGATMNVIANQWIETNSYIRQRIPKGVLSQSKSYTVAWMTGDGVVHVDNSAVSFRSIEAGLNYDEVYVNIAGETIAIVWAALYEGSYTEETLPPYSPKGYAVELAECMRYYQTAYRVFGSAIGSATREAINLRPPMRIAPTVSHKSLWSLEGTATYNVSAAAPEYVDITYTEWGSAELVFSADL